MDEIVKRLHEKKQIEKAKAILESEGYAVESRLRESLSDSEKQEILKMFNSSNQDVLDSREETEDGAKVFVVECDNSNPTYISDLQSKLDSLESKDIGYDREDNGNGFYGRNYIFYKYEDFNESKDINEGEENTQQDRKSLMTENPTFKKMDALCQAHGYRLTRAYVDVYKNDTDKYPCISIEGVQKFHPDIYYNNDFFGKQVRYFEIQTTAYGSMKKDEYELFLKGCQDAYDLVVELESIDLDTLAQFNRGYE